MGSGANAQPTGYAFYAKSDPNAQAEIQKYQPEGVLTRYMDNGEFYQHFRVSRPYLKDLVYQVSMRAEEMGYSNSVTGPENAADLFDYKKTPNYGTATVAELKQFGVKTLKIGYILNGKLVFENKALSDLDDAIEFGGLYDANSAHFFPILKKGIQGSGKDCCFNICYPKQEEDTYVDQGGDDGGQYSGQTVNRSGGGIVLNNYNIISGSGNSSSDQTQEQTQTAPAPAPQQSSGFVDAQISYQQVPMQMSQPINYNPGYSAPPVNYGNSGTVVCKNRPNGLQVADFIVDVATLGVGIYGANQSWQANHTPPPIFHVTGGNTTYGNNSYNSGAYGNGLLPPYVGHGGGTGTGGGPIDIGNGGPGNH